MPSSNYFSVSGEGSIGAAQVVKTGVCETRDRGGRGGFRLKGGAVAGLEQTPS